MMFRRSVSLLAARPVASTTSALAWAFPALCSSVSGRAMSTERIACIGSGNWGSAVARIVARNALSDASIEDEVKMWVFEEEVEGKKLTDIINQEHENVKYLPGAKFTPNLKAVPSIADTCEGATALVMCVPHQFLGPVLKEMKPVLAPGAKAISLIKGMDFDDNGPVLISDLIRKGLDVDCSILMGANVAKGVGDDEFCEATIGYSDPKNGELWRTIFDSPTFKVNTVNDPNGVELCGALKNIVAIGAGFCDGLGYGTNTKAAIIRIGLMEMIKFCKKYYTGIKDETFLESCGVADLITTCFGGRNRLCAEAYVTSGMTFDEIEAKMLNGQKLQGTLTATEVLHVLERTNAIDEFPFFVTVARIVEGSRDPVAIVHDIAP